MSTPASSTTTRARVVVGGDHHDRLAERAHLVQLGERDAACDRWRGAGRHRLLLLRGRRPVRGRRRLDEGVVDEAGGADARRHGDEHPAVDGRDRLEAVGVDEREVLGLDAVHRGAGGGGDRARRRARRRRPRPRRRAGARESATARSRSSGVEADVAAGQREAVGLAHGRDDLELDRQVEVAHHPAQDRDLLRVLLAEEGDVGRDDVEQLGDDRADAGEVARAALGALEHVGEALDAHAWWRSPAGRPPRPAARTARRRRARPPRRRRAPRCAGRRRGRAASSNCAGLTNSETTTSSQRSRAARISAWWPAWKAPIVGTRPTVRPAPRAPRDVGAHLGDGADRPHARHRPRGVDERVEQRQQLGRALRHRGALARDRLLVAAGDRAGQRLLGARARPSSRRRRARAGRAARGRRRRWPPAARRRPRA